MAEAKDHLAEVTEELNKAQSLDGREKSAERPADPVMMALDDSAVLQLRLRA